MLSEQCGGLISHAWAVQDRLQYGTVEPGEKMRAYAGDVGDTWLCIMQYCYLYQIIWHCISAFYIILSYILHYFRLYISSFLAILQRVEKVKGNLCERHTSAAVWLLPTSGKFSHPWWSTISMSDISDDVGETEDVEARSVQAGGVVGRYVPLRFWEWPCQRKRKQLKTFTPERKMGPTKRSQMS